MGQPHARCWGRCGTLRAGAGGRGAGVKLTHSSWACPHPPRGIAVGHVPRRETSRIKRGNFSHQKGNLLASKGAECRPAHTPVVVAHSLPACKQGDACAKRGDSEGPGNRAKGWRCRRRARLACQRPANTLAHSLASCLRPISRPTDSSDPDWLPTVVCLACGVDQALEIDAEGGGGLKNHGLAADATGDAAVGHQAGQLLHSLVVLS